MPVSGLIEIAPNWQAATQSPQPRQPNPQPVSPAPHEFIAAQVCKPSYSAMRGRFSQVPLQRTTATFGSVLATAIPKRSATLPITSAPPTGHISPSIEPASAPFTRAAAIPEHPAKPQPPQLAPGRISPTWPKRGSSSTANFLNTPKRTSAAISAIAPRTKTAIKIKFIIFCVLFCYFLCFKIKAHRRNHRSTSRTLCFYREAQLVFKFVSE